MASNVRLGIRSRFATLRQHGDLLWLQGANWVSGQLLFAVLGGWAPNTTLARAAFLETLAAFFGTTFASIAFRVGFTSVTAMRAQVGIRFSLFFAMCGLSVAGKMEWAWTIGIAPSLLTPAHFPIVYGARRWAAALLIAFRLMACAMLMTLALSPSQAFAVYFVPGVAYAIALYVIYFGDWACVSACDASTRIRLPKPAAFVGNSHLDAFLLLPWASAGFFFMQASVVSAIAAASPALAVGERLLRSGYSMAYPYMMRSSKLDSALRRCVRGFSLAVPAAAVASAVTPVAVFIWAPTFSDLVVTQLFRLGRSRLVLVTVWATLCAFCLACIKSLI